MKIILIHNKYGSPAGEESVVNNAQHLLEEKGHQVIPFFRTTEGICEMPFGKMRAFFSGIYSWSSRKAIHQILKIHRPHIAFVHNVFPFISPSVLSECRQAGVPIVMSVNNFRLICPDGLFLPKGKVQGHICEKCAGGREYWCVLRNCEEDILKSIGYATRNAVARWLRLFADNVTIYAPMTEFQRQKLIQEGFPAERTIVIPNVVNHKFLENIPPQGDYVGHVGRISPEKGVHVLVEAARKCPHTHIKVTGSTVLMPHLVCEAPENVEFCGRLSEEQLCDFYTNSRFTVLCSICYEGFPTVLLETMMYGKPVVASRIGGISEIIDDGVTGLLFEPGNSEDLAEKIRFLWSRPDLCCKMGWAGREKALREYSPEKYYERLMKVYQRAIEIVRKQD